MGVTKQMAGWQATYLERYYPSSQWVDGTSEFHDLCSSYIQGARILEVGAGPSNATSRFLSTLGEVHGVDIDPEVQNNDALKTASVISSDVYPFPDSYFDACVSNYVNEHVTDPTSHLAEAARVLKPGGVYIFRTPNSYHYTALVSSLTPHRFHLFAANRLRNLPEGAHDPYPTAYRMNTRRAIKRLANSAGFAVEELRMVEKEPSYGMSSRLLFFAFLAYERAVNFSAAFAWLRANIFGVLRKHV